jgi:hypothetical protein
MFQIMMERLTRKGNIFEALQDDLVTKLTVSKAQNGVTDWYLAKGNGPKNAIGPVDIIADPCRTRTRGIPVFIKSWPGLDTALVTG